MRKIEIPVHAIKVKDKDSGEEKTIQTVRTVEMIINYLQETEREALGDALDRVEYERQAKEKGEK